MNRRPTLPQRLARWSLFLAAVLQFGAAAAGPYWHLTAYPLAAGPVVQSPGEDGSGAPAGTHDEQACIVCQSASAAWVLPAPTPLPFIVVAAHGELPGSTTSPPRAAPSDSRARAPPLA